jgi:gamma-glutamyl hercynylcysteine S-oxide synthase
MMRHALYPAGITRAQLVEWYRAVRGRTAELLDFISPDAYYDRPIVLRNPIVFYEGHMPAFCVNTLVKLALRENGVDGRLETLFARGIDPEDEASAKTPTDLWPARGEVQKFAAACDALVENALRNATLEDEDVPTLRGGEAVFTVLEHETMHHETLLYMLHELPYAKKRAPRRFSTTPPRSRAAKLAAGETLVQIPAGRATLGTPAGLFGWDNEFPSHVVSVPAFAIDAHNVTNGDYLAYVEAADAAPPHFWHGDGAQWCFRGMFELKPLDLDAPVYVTHDEAEAYARWKGRRLPTEAEYTRAAYGAPDGSERMYPWGDDPPDPTRGNFDFQSLEPVAVGSYPAGASAWGVHDLVGNGWEWTSTVFDGFDGFRPMPSYAVYSADFFDGAHYVLKGASPVTARELIRPGFRNWFRPNYPYVYATFRCVS